MVLISQNEGGKQPRNADVHLIFGVGLIGSSICNHLLARGRLKCTERQFSWGEAEHQCQQLKDIETALIAPPSAGPDSHAPAARRRINIVWSAGKSGFASEDDEATDELAA